MKNRQLIVWFAVLLASAVAGCATARSTTGKDFDTSKVSRIVKGETTAAQLVEMFGTPQSKQPEANGGERWSYSYADATAHASSFFTTKVTTEGYKKNLAVLLDASGKVTNFTLDEGPIPKQTTTSHQF